MSANTRKRKSKSDELPDLVDLHLGSPFNMCVTVPRETHIKLNIHSAETGKQLCTYQLQIVKHGATIRINTMPQIQDPNLPPEIWLQYYIRFLSKENGTWDYVIPETRYEETGSRRLVRIERGERSKAIRIFNEIITAGMKYDGKRIVEMHLVYGGDLKSENKSVDGGQIMQKVFQGEMRPTEIWDPAPPPEVANIPEPEEMTVPEAPQPAPNNDTTGPAAAPEASAPKKKTKMKKTA